MEAKDRAIMSIMRNAFGKEIPVGAFIAVTDAYQAGIREIARRLEKDSIDMIAGLLPDNFDYTKDYAVIEKAKLKEYGLWQSKN